MGGFSNAYAEGLRSNAGGAGLEVVAAASYEMQIESTYEPAIARLRDANVNIIVAIIWNQDALGLLKLAKQYGLVGTGKVWIVPDTVAPGDALQGDAPASSV